MNFTLVNNSFSYPVNNLTNYNKKSCSHPLQCTNKKEHTMQNPIKTSKYRKLFFFLSKYFFTYKIDYFKISFSRFTQNIWTTLQSHSNLFINLNEKKLKHQIANLFGNVKKKYKCLHMTGQHFLDSSNPTTNHNLKYSQISIHTFLIVIICTSAGRDTHTEVLGQAQVQVIVQGIQV